MDNVLAALQQNMAKLHLLVSDHSSVGGVAIEFPSGVTKSISWCTNQPITDTKAAAQQYASAFLQHLLDERRVDDAERTNWVSVTAAIQAHIAAWNAKLRGVAGCSVVDQPANPHTESN